MERKKGGGWEVGDIKELEVCEQQYILVLVLGDSAHVTARAILCLQRYPRCGSLGIYMGCIVSKGIIIHHESSLGVSKLVLTKWGKPHQVLH